MKGLYNMFLIPVCGHILTLWTMLVQHTKVQLVTEYVVVEKEEEQQQQ